MTRTEYLKQLDKYLRRLPQEEYQEAMEHFREYFDEAGPEQEIAVIDDLGSPKEAARNILNSLLDKGLEKSLYSKNTKQIIWIAILAISAAPIALPLIAALLVLILAIFAVGLSIILTTASLSIIAFLSFFSLLWEALAALSNTASFSIALGSSLFSLGSSLILAVITVLSVRLIKLILIKFSQWIIKRGKK
ncbi:DUF1700 domain-containing protein [Streptococcus macacae]|uniref:PF08006 family protein n=1 Tax=Streptococcus macacae NCTC 11558 TaxID=764298 RepID=G5JY85_9STRE|nr:DUF1700 domain-containing protein [Streptococcus macacae]EHJ51563.1 hypothetical protein STRMA_0145 [Streptococcus macacae NCTC 11558]SUN77999.1 hypothetical membrane associated protein [Streptococcus macacae NCTC 11558]